MEKATIDIIREMYDQFFQAEQKVADLIINYPEKAVNANVSELANLSGVSDSTVIRLCKHMGFQGYYQLRISLARDLGREGMNHENNGKVESTISGLFQSFELRMEEIAKNLAEDKMRECVNLIRTCNCVHIAAVGNTSSIAQYMGFRLGRLGINCTYHLIPEYTMNYINLGKEKDILFAISQSGSSKQVIQAMELAKEKKMKIIAVVGSEFSPASGLTDCLLLSDKKDPFDHYKSHSRLNEMAVIDAVLHFVTNEEMIAAQNADKPEMILSEYKL